MRSETKGYTTFLSRGPSLSIEIEVNSVRHGPASNISLAAAGPTVALRIPEADQVEALGDSGKNLRVKDNYYWDRPICEFTSDPNDLLGRLQAC